MTEDREPIVSAVLADPVAKAVLEDPSAAPAVINAIGPDAALAPAQTTQAAKGETQHGTTTSKTFGETILGERGQSVASPTSTEEEDRVTAGQREVNLIWESTQMRIALSVIWASLFVSSALSVFGRDLGSPELQLAAVVFLFGVANLVTGFYFGRTNHQKVGGVEQGR